MSTSPASNAADFMTVPVRHGMFCWFEHHSDVPERAVEYWTALVGGEHAAVPLPCGNIMHLMNSGEHHRWSLRALAGCPALAAVAGWHGCVAPSASFLPAPFLFSFSFRIGGGLLSYPLPPGGWSVHSMIGLKVCDDGAPR